MSSRSVGICFARITSANSLLASQRFRSSAASFVSSSIRSPNVVAPIYSYSFCSMKDY